MILVVKLFKFFCKVSFMVKLVVVSIVMKEVVFIFIILVMVRKSIILSFIFMIDERKGIRFLLIFVMFMVLVFMWIRCWMIFRFIISSMMVSKKGGLYFCVILMMFCS